MAERSHTCDLTESATKRIKLLDAEPHSEENVVIRMSRITKLFHDQKNIFRCKYTVK